MLMVNKIYVTHYTPLMDRKIKLAKDLADLDMQVQWFEQEPSEADIQELHSNTDALWKKKTQDLDYGGPIPWKYLTKSEISLAYKHIKVYEDMIENGVNTALVLEDDVVFEDDFINKFNFNLMATPHDWDMIFIGSGCDLRIAPHRRENGKVAYLKPHPASKCTDSYLIKQSAADKLYKTIFPFTMPIDFELNYQMSLHNMHVYWWEPPLIRQGSQCGLYDSEIMK